MLDKSKLESFTKYDSAIYQSVDKAKEHVKKNIELCKKDIKKIQEEVKKSKAKAKQIKSKLSKRGISKEEKQAIKVSEKIQLQHLKAVEKSYEDGRRIYMQLKEKQKQYIGLEKMAVKFVNRPTKR